jgi:glycosyltransferase involved in cell wall biosynthesis
MVILQVETSRGFGGQEEWVLCLSAALARKGHRVRIACCPDSPVSRKADQLGIPRWPLQVRNNLDPKAILGLLWIIRRDRVEVVHTHNVKATWAAYVASHLSSIFFRRPILVRTRYLVYRNRYSFPYSHLSDRVVVVSPYLRDYLVKEKGIASSKVHIIPPGVDTDLFNTKAATPDARQELGIPQGVPVIGMVAFLRAEKGHRILIEAARIVLRYYPETRFLLVGSGQIEGSLRNLVEQWGMSERFIFTGYRTDVPRLLAAMDVFVLPSLREVMPISLMEAMAMERPAVASGVGGIPELVVNGETGLLVPPENPVALADGLLFSISHPSVCDTWGKNARKKIEGEYSLRHATDQTVALYKELQAEVHRVIL